jgi:hypothetical protein
MQDTVGAQLAAMDLGAEPARIVDDVVGLGMRPGIGIPGRAKTGARNFAVRDVRQHQPGRRDQQAGRHVPSFTRAWRQK